MATSRSLSPMCLLTWDHFFPLGTDRSGPHLECWTVLAAWAETTRHADIGALVSNVGFRNADLLADMARTVDHISGGRLVLGVGAGFREWEAREYGYPFGTPGWRVDDLGEALQRIRRRLGRVNPPPLRPLPIMVAADGPRALQLAARHADVWHSFARADTFAAKSRRLDAYCAEAGRDPATVTRSVFAAGDPATTGEALRAHGAGTFVLITHGPGYDLGELRQWLAWRDEVNARP